MLILREVLGPNSCCIPPPSSSDMFASPVLEKLEQRFLIFRHLRANEPVPFDMSGVGGILCHLLFVSFDMLEYLCLLGERHLRH